MNKLMKVLSLGAALAAFAPLAFATPTLLIDGAGNAPVGTIAGGYGSLVVTTGLQSGTPAPLGNALLFTANYTESVYQGGSNAFCPLCLNFVYQFNNSGQAGSHIDNISTSDFSGFAVASAYVTGTGTHAPTSDKLASGVVNFYFAPIPPDSTNTDILVLFTDATSYDFDGTLTFQDGVTLDVQGYEPAIASPVPEPSSLMLLGTGLLTAVGVARRKLKA